MANAAYGVWTPQSCARCSRRGVLWLMQRMLSGPTVPQSCARCSRRGVLWLMQRMVSGPHSLVLGVVGEECCG